MKQIGKIIENYSFTKDEAMKVYTDCIMQDIDFTKPQEYDAKTFSLAAVISYEMTENKIAVENIIEYINAQFLSEKEKVKTIMDEIFAILNKNSPLPDFVINMQKEHFDIITKDINKLIDTNQQKKFSLIYYDRNSKDLNNTSKTDIKINSSGGFKNLYKGLEELKSKCESLKAKGYEVMFGPYITEEDLKKVGEEALKHFKNSFN